MTACGCAWVDLRARGVLLLLGALLAFSHSVQGQIATDEELAEATLVIYNSEDASSADLAGYYARKRKIPARQVMGLAMPQKEEISRAEYVDTIERPLRSEFLRNKWWTMDGENIAETKIRFVVLMRGVPMKIAPGYEMKNVSEEQQKNPLTFRDEASVDSELAVMGFIEAPDVGIVPNFYYRSFRPIAEAGIPPLLLVTRLDAPSPMAVMRMIDDALHAEEHGLYGWHVVDWRGNNPTDNRKDGDEWLMEIVADLREKKLPIRFQGRPDSFQNDPLDDVAMYFGWYDHHATPAFKVNRRIFRPGSIACHIHSFSAATVRVPGENWVGSLLDRGATVALGNVYEPYLGMTHQVNIFYNRLQSGRTIAEAAYASTPVLSWMGVVFGDPLYRPYKSSMDLLHEPDLQGEDKLWAGLTTAYAAHTTETEPAVFAKIDALQEEFPDSTLPLYVKGLLAFKREDFRRVILLFDPAFESVKNPAIRAHMVEATVYAHSVFQETDAIRALLHLEYHRDPDGIYAPFYRQIAARYGVPIPEGVNPPN